MSNKVFLLLFFLFFLNLNSYSQTLKKTLKTNFSEEKITIDGKFDEEIWKTSDIATNFLMVAPDNG